ncbi:MAG: hypothetical protein D3909_09160 [Candidatus Electrothrix sp. ATG1]|nr:hypothetical protein [Candidatus Electrothrix sp. ATG1]
MPNYYLAILDKKIQAAQGEASWDLKRSPITLNTFVGRQIQLRTQIKTKMSHFALKSKLYLKIVPSPVFLSLKR